MSISNPMPVRPPGFKTSGWQNLTLRKGAIRLGLTTLGILLTVSIVAGFYFYTINANRPVLDQRWAKSDESSQFRVDHSHWQSVIDDYLITDTDSGVNLFDYSGLLDDGRDTLDNYIKQLVSINPLTLDRLEQKPYWINLYNAATVQLIIDNYPVASITNLGTNLLRSGPWDDNVVEINGTALSLNDIEHRIIRPLYDDYRIHFAVSCASIGCPNLAANVFTADGMEQQLDNAAAEYLNHPRGLNLKGDALQLSSLFKWYAEDFGDSQAAVLATLGKHTVGQVTALLSQFDGTPTYEYDWSLNGYCQVDDECGE